MAKVFDPKTGQIIEVPDDVAAGTSYDPSMFSPPPPPAQPVQQFNQYTGEFQQGQVQAPQFQQPLPPPPTAPAGPQYGQDVAFLADPSLPVGGPDSVQANGIQQASANTYAQGGGIRMNLQPTRPKEAAQPSNGLGGLPSVQQIMADAQRGRGAGGPLVTQTQQINRTIDLAPSTPEQIQAMTQLDEAYRMASAESEAATNSMQALAYKAQQARLQSEKEYQTEVNVQSALREQNRKEMVDKRDEVAGLLTKGREDIANAKINPKEIWEKKGSVASLFAVIGQTLGAFGSSLSKSPNYAAQMLDAEIERNIQAQRDAIQNKKESLSAQEREYQSLVNQLGSYDAASMVQEDRLRESFDHMLGTQLAGIEDESKARQLELIRAQNKQQQVLNAKNLMQDTIGRVVVNQTVRNRSGGGGGKRMTELEARAERARVAKLENEAYGGDRDSKNEVPGVGYATNQQGAKDTIETIAYATNAIIALNQLSDMAKGSSAGGVFGSIAPGGASMSSDAAKAESLQNDTAMSLAKAKDPGSVIREGEMALSKRLVPNPYTTADDVALERYNTQISEMRKRVRSMAESNGMNGDEALRKLDENLANAGLDANQYQFGNQ